MSKLSINKKSSEPREARLFSRGFLHDFSNRYLDESFFGSPFFGHRFFNKNFSSFWWPKTDISETDKEIKIDMNIPGVKPEDIKIEINNGQLEISGSTESEKEEKGKNWYRAERESGEFKRVFDIPPDIKIDEIEAETKNGTLYINIPKGEGSEKKRIKIKSEK